MLEDQIAMKQARDFGKDGVRGSIPRGSTSFPLISAVPALNRLPNSAPQRSTKPEPGNSARAQSVQSVPPPFPDYIDPDRGLMTPREAWPLLAICGAGWAAVALIWLRFT